MADTFRLDFVGTKAGIKGASVVMGYLETGMRVLDSASGLLSRLQELAVLGANDTNTESDTEAIDREAEAIADEFHRLMSTSTYKGKDVFVATAGGEYVSMGGRDAEMTFGLGRVAYQEMYVHTSYAAWDAETTLTSTVAAVGLGGGLLTDVIMKGSHYVATTTDLDAADVTLYADTATADDGEEFNGIATGVITTAGTVRKTLNQLRFSAGEGMYTEDASNNPQTNLLTTVIQNVQAKVNTARVQAGSQYAALESAVNYTTDLTAQYELGYNTVNDVNFSMETAHLAKNQILQQAATAMLAQANQGQQGLLQLIS
jgi:flagellin